MPADLIQPRELQRLGLPTEVLEGSSDLLC